MRDGFVEALLAGHPAEVAATRSRDGRAFIESCAYEGKLNWLRDLAERALTHEDPEDADHALAVLEAIEDTLAQTPGAAPAAEALAIAALREDGPEPFPATLEPRLAALASVLASEQDVGALRFLFDGPAQGARAEGRALLLHELVLRGVFIDETPELAAERDVLDTSGHPLAALPIPLLELELGLEELLPRYSLSSTSWARPASELASEESDPPQPKPTPLLRFEALSGPRRELWLESTKRWSSVSSGEAVTGRFSGLPWSAWAPGSRAELELVGLEGVALEGRQLTATELFERLFAAASQPGPDGRSQMGAYGRLSAWRSVAGFLGADPGTPVPQLAERLEAAGAVELFAPQGPFIMCERALALLLWPDPAADEAALLWVWDGD